MYVYGTSDSCTDCGTAATCPEHDAVVCDYCGESATVTYALGIATWNGSAGVWEDTPGEFDACSDCSVFAWEDVQAQAIDCVPSVWRNVSHVVTWEEYPYRAQRIVAHAPNGARDGWNPGVGWVWDDATRGQSAWIISEVTL